MEQNKYYTPSIEDFKIGYEYEQYRPSFYNDGGKVENKSTWNKDIIKEPLMYGDTLSKNIEKKYIRTPYLTKEQVVSFLDRFYDFEDEDDDGSFSFKIGKGGLEYSLFYTEMDRMLSIREDKDCYYLGSCRCINDFKTICNLININ